MELNQGVYGSFHSHCQHFATMPGDASYGTVPNATDPSWEDWTVEPPETTTRGGSRRVRTLVSSVAVIVLVGGFGWLYWSREELLAGSPHSRSAMIFPHASLKASSSNLPMPTGVNIGSWLALEDYFFAGGSAVEVATPDGDTAAVCLPPLHTGQETGPTWHAETDLLSKLREETSLAHALRVFHAHRLSFVDFEEDLETLKNLGIHSVRVPISWCLTDEDPSYIDPHDTNDTELEAKFTCADPFYEGVLWPAIPRSLLVNLLKACGRHGIGATLDMHTYPGATSPGTFSGLWPLWPRFWTHGDQPATDNGAVDIGRNLWKDMVSWIASLDHEALRGLQALSPMNEPAHLAGIFRNGRGKDGPFLPPLPTEMAQAYRAKLAASHPSTHHSHKYTEVPDGPHLRVFKWLDDAIDVFRNSELPSRGIELAVNVHESVLNPKILGDPDDDDGFAMAILAAWWRGVTSKHERKNWAVLDVHHYHAWDPKCQGASDGPGPDGSVANYTCSDVEARDDSLRRCAGWATVLRDTMDYECGHSGAKLMSGEMSASTHHSVQHACNDLSTLRSSYMVQIAAAQEANVDVYWWSFKMPHGGAFRPAWSLKHFLWLMGVMPRPDESEYGCGDHVPIAGEPHLFN